MPPSNVYRGTQVHRLYSPGFLSSVMRDSLECTVISKGKNNKLLKQTHTMHLWSERTAVGGAVGNRETTDTRVRIVPLGYLRFQL